MAYRFVSMRRPPRRFACTALVVLPLLTFGAMGCSLDDDGARVNRLVERQYLEHMGLTGSVEADCTWVKVL